MWQWDYRAETKERFETPNLTSDQVMELYYYEEMQRRWEKALVNNTEPTEFPMPYSREKRRQALLLTQPNLKFADELVYSASTFSSTRANHFMHESILAPIEKHVYGPLRDVREKIKAGLVKEAEAILMETERKALKMTPHEYYVERKSKSQKEAELARGGMKRMTAEEEEQWKLQLQQRFDNFSEQEKGVNVKEIDSREAEIAAIREKIRQFHEESSKAEEQEEERTIRQLEQAANIEKMKNVGLNTLFAKGEGKAVKTVEKGVPEPEELQDPVLRSDDTAILIQLKKDPEEEFEARLEEGSSDSGMTVSSKGDGRQDVPGDNVDKAAEEAEQSREETREAPRSEFTVSQGAAPFTFTTEAPAKKEEAGAQGSAEEPVQAKPQPETSAETEEPRVKTETTEQIREEVKARAEESVEERVDERVEDADAKSDQRGKAEAREEEYIDPRDREDHERVDIAERSEDTDLDKMQEAETRSKYEQRKERREKETQDEAEEAREVSVLDAFFKDEKSIAQLEAEKMLAEHQKQIDDNTEFRGLIKASKERKAKAGAFGLSLRSTPEGGVGKVKEAAATVPSHHITKRQTYL